MRPDITWAAGLLFAAAALGSPSAQAALAEDADFALAMEHYERYHDAAAFAVLARLADAGHSEAARIAVLMCGQGARLFRFPCAASPDQRRIWLDTAAARATGQHAAR